MNTFTDLQPISTMFNYSHHTRFEDQKEKNREEESWEVNRWWLRFHGDVVRWIDCKAALQFRYRSFSDVVFYDVSRPLRRPVDSPKG